MSQTQHHLLRRGMVQPRQILRILWRMLPQDARRRAISRLLGVIAPRPDLVPAPAAAGLAVAGPFDEPSGIGEGARLMLAALQAMGVPHWAVRPGGPVPPPGVPLLIAANPALLGWTALRLGRRMLRGRRVIGYWAWELPVAPPSWKAALPFVHEIWAPSQFSADALAPLGRPVRVVPHPVAIRPPVPGPRVDLSVPAGAVVTLVVFNLASSFERKNPLGAIAAHRLAFGDRMDRILLLRVGHPDSFPHDFARVVAAAAAPNIRIDTRTLPDAEHWAVMAASDIVLSLHRSEGFGLVPAEAMLLGLPVVATDWSGTQTFLSAECAALVPVRLVPAHDPRGVFVAPGAVWAEPDVVAAAAALVRLADDPAARHAMGAAGRRAAQERLGAGPLAAALAALR